MTLSFPGPIKTTAPGGLSGFIGWQRLVEHLRRTGEIKRDEEVVHIVADKHGLTYYLETKP